jgi:2-phospho-L-lactate transferase/gluconeogenesis factor (CofD/UPF0052 family)
LTVNTTLRKTTSSATVYDRNVRSKAALGASVYETLNTMLRVNTRLSSKLPPFDDAVVDERLLESREQIKLRND